jgi:hypothetical protein
MLAVIYIICTVAITSPAYCNNALRVMRKPAKVCIGPHTGSRKTPLNQADAPRYPSGEL